MGESLLEKWMNARIRHILQVSYYMKEDILYRHKKAESSQDEFLLEEQIPYREDYSFGWKKIIEDAIIKYWVADGFIFTGPDGCGKHTAAELAYCALEKQFEDFFAFVFLPAKALVFSPMEQKAYEEERFRIMEKGFADAFTEDIVHYFFELLFRQLPKDHSICLMIDNSEQFDMKAVYEHLGQYMCISQCEFRRMELAGEEMYDTPLLQNLFTIIIDKEDYNIPSLLHKKLLLIRMSYPTFQQRLTLLKTMGLYDEISGLIAQKTENYNYAQLRNLAKNAQIFSVFDESLDDTFYNEIVSSQLSFKQEGHQKNIDSVLQSPMAEKENDRLAEEKIRLYQKIEQLIENLPEILEKISSSVALTAQQKAVVSSKEQEEEPLSISQIQKHQESLIQQKPSDDAIASESANMELCDLLGSVMGQERMKRIETNRT